MKKPYMIILALAASLAISVSGLTAKAYTEEEKAFAKSMLSAYGYSPDMAGAQQAYQDYLAGKFNDICEQYGFPKQNVGADDGDDPDGSGGTDSGDGTGGTGTNGANGAGGTGTDGTNSTGENGTNGAAGTDGASANGSQGILGNGISKVIQAGNYSQDPDDGRIHFNQTRGELGVYTISLEEIWADTSIQPPIVRNDGERIDSQETDMAYIDLVFRVENEGTQEIDVKELLSIVLKDNQGSYSHAVLLQEKDHGAAFTEETLLQGNEEGLFHFGFLVPASAEDFVGKVSLNGVRYEVYFDTDTHPKNRVVWEKDATLAALDFASVRYMGKTFTGTEKANTLSVDVSLTNSLTEEGGTGDFLGLLAIYDGNLYRGMAESAPIQTGETKEIRLTLDLPAEASEEDVETLVYFDGSWYAVE